MKFLERRTFVLIFVGKKTSHKTTAFNNYGNEYDYIFYYVKDKNNYVWDQPYKPYNKEQLRKYYTLAEKPDRTYTKLAKEQIENPNLIPKSWRRFRWVPTVNLNYNRPNLTYEFLGVKKVWAWKKERMEELYNKGLIIQEKPGTIPKKKQFLDEIEGQKVSDIWLDIFNVHGGSSENTNYVTQKPEALLERIIKASSNEGMVVADFFSGSGTTAKVTNNLNRKFIACDIGINALHTTRDRLVKAGTDFNILKIKDGLRLFRNPKQTTKIIFSCISGFKSTKDLDLSSFWNGGVASTKGFYTPIKFSGIHNTLTKELLDVYLEEIYKLENTTAKTSGFIIIYAHKDLDIDQQYLNKQLNQTTKTELPVKLVSLDRLLGEKKDFLFASDSASIEITQQGEKYKVEIKKFYSPYLYKKLKDYNAKKTLQDAMKKEAIKVINISDSGLEMIEAVQFDTTLQKVWKSNPNLEYQAGIKEKVKSIYILDTNTFKIKIRNIAGDEIVIDSREIQKHATL